MRISENKEKPGNKTSGRILLTFAMSSWAHGVNVLPEMAQANAQNLALQMLKQQKEQVQAPEESGHSSQVSDREKGNGGTWREPRHGERKTQQKDLTENAGDIRPSENPLVGKLLNVRT